jgi:methyl-accepting chemotaxis protein
MAYWLSEMVGRHHSMFVDDAYKASPAYAQFWDALKRGEHKTANSSGWAKAVARFGCKHL